MQLIDKDVVIAKIEELDEYWHLSKSDSGQAFVESLLSFLDTLEVKEVDLEKEYKMFVDCDEGRSMFETSRHFFELGLKTKEK